MFFCLSNFWLDWRKMVLRRFVDVVLGMVLFNSLSVNLEVEEDGTMMDRLYNVFEFYSTFKYFL